jgi:hypothetical protein
MKVAPLTVLRASTLLTLISLVAVVGIVLWHAYPSSEAVRLRNALLMQADPSALSDWTPKNVPASFKLERLPVPELMLSAARRAAAATDGTDLAVARALTAHLMEHATKGGRIDSFDVAQTYKTIVASGAGYCSDVIDSYIALAQAVGLFVRPWAFSFDGFGGLGHIVIEIYDRQSARWIMLDVFNNVLPVDANKNTPLSVREFIAAFSVDSRAVLFLPIGSGRKEFAIYEKLVEYYRSGIGDWYFWNGNNVFGRADHWVIRAAELLGEGPAELASLALHKFPEIIPIATTSNRAHIQYMKSIEMWLLISLAAIISLTSIFMLQLVMLTRARNY